MRVLQGRPGEEGTDEPGESPSGEPSYDQGYQQAALWNEATNEAGMAARSDDVDADRIPVINTKSGRLICGAAAPMKKNLDLYLRDRPYMQVFESMSAGNGVSSSGRKRVLDADAENQDGASFGIKLRDSDTNDGRAATDKRKSHEHSNGTSTKKRFKTVAGPPTEAMDHEVLSALETWSDAMQEASDMLDKEACSSVLQELLALHERVQTKQNVGDTASLRALIVSQFPKTCLDILRSLEDFDTMRLTECVTAALNIDQQMSDGKNLGDEELSALGREKILELDKLGQRNEQLSKDFEEIRKQEEEAISHHTEELQKTRATILELRAEEQKLREQLEEVNAEAVQHLGVLQAYKASENADGAEPNADIEELCESIWKSDETQREMSELLRVRGSVDRARDGVNAAQSHLNLMHYVCEFSAEVRKCMESYCNDELLQALQRELEALQQDKVKLEHIAEQLTSIREEDAGGAESARTGLTRTASLRDKYKRFYNERIQDMRSKHFKSRHTASGLIAYFEPENMRQEAFGTNMDVKKILQCAKEIVTLVDRLQKSTDENSSPSEPFEEVAHDSPGSTLALYPGSRVAQTWDSGCIPKCIDELGKIAEKPSVKGRLVVKGSTNVVGMELCGIIDAVHGGVGEASTNMGEASAAAGCVCHALDEVCRGKRRTALCLVPYVVLKRESISSENGLPQRTYKFPFLSAALLHARVEHAWVQRIAVIDLVRPSEPLGTSVDAQILQVSPIKEAEGQAQFQAERLVCRKQWAEAARGSGDAQMQDADREADERAPFVERWKRGLENEVLSQLKEFKPQLLVVNIESVLHLEGARNARTLSAQNFVWAGTFLARDAASLTNGRLVVVWDMAGGSSWLHRSVADFMRGILEAQNATP